jgi:hypothetical protein
MALGDMPSNIPPNLLDACDHRRIATEVVSQKTLGK